MSISRHGAKLCSLGLTVLVLAACGDGGSSPPTQSSANPPASNPPATGSNPPTTGVNPPATGANPPAAGDPPASTPPPSDGAPSIPNSAPTISGKPATAALRDKAYTFTPEAADPDGDVITFRIKQKPAWATFSEATGQLTGTPRATDLGEYKDIVISVTDGAAEAALDAFAIVVTDLGNGAATLTWEPPTENTDGTPLTDLAGYKIYYGTSPGVYSNTIQIDNPGLTSYVVDGLVPATYYFVATAFNQAGVESDTSNVATSEIL